MFNPFLSPVHVVKGKLLEMRFQMQLYNLQKRSIITINKIETLSYYFITDWSTGKLNNKDDTIIIAKILPEDIKCLMDSTLYNCKNREYIDLKRRSYILAMHNGNTENFTNIEIVYPDKITKKLFNDIEEKQVICLR